MTDRLKNLYGPKCTAVNVNGSAKGFINIPSRQMKFCEATDKSFNIPIRLDESNLGCPGARRCVGYDNDDVKLGNMISANNGIPQEFINEALNSIPVMDKIKYINLGISEELEVDLKPDLYIMYIQSFKLTPLLHSLAKIPIKPSIPPFFILSVCGNIFANSYLNNVVSISFGCPESRKSGGIAKDELVVAIPAGIAAKLLEIHSQ